MSLGHAQCQLCYPEVVFKKILHKSRRQNDFSSKNFTNGKNPTPNTDCSYSQVTRIMPQENSTSPALPRQAARNVGLLPCCFGDTAADNVPLLLKPNSVHCFFTVWTFNSYYLLCSLENEGLDTLRSCSQTSAAPPQQDSRLTTYHV